MRAREWLDQERREQRQKAFEEGRTQAILQLLTHQFERRMKRELNDAEQKAIRLRLDEQGHELVSNVVLDSSAEELEAWLAQGEPE